MPLLHMQLGEVSPGGVGVGLNGMLVLALLAVFIAGLMVGRTPEYLGKKIQAAEIKLVALYILAMPLVILHADPLWRSLPVAAFQRIRAVCEDGERIALPGRWAALALVPLLFLGATRGEVAGTRMIPASFDAELFPVEAVEYARSNRITGRVFNLFWWGGYLIYAWPEQKIFIDGMTDYFSEDLLKDYGTIEVGKVADILVLGADPTVDIRNIRKLDMVMKGGAVIDHKSLPTIRIWSRNP